MRPPLPPVYLRTWTARDGTVWPTWFEWPVPSSRLRLVPDEDGETQGGIRYIQEGEDFWHVEQALTACGYALSVDSTDGDVVFWFCSHNPPGARLRALRQLIRGELPPEPIDPPEPPLPLTPPEWEPILPHLRARPGARLREQAACFPLPQSVAVRDCLPSGPARGFLALRRYFSPDRLTLDHHEGTQEQREAALAIFSSSVVGRLRFRVLLDYPLVGAPAETLVDVPTWAPTEEGELGFGEIFGMAADLYARVYHQDAEEQGRRADEPAPRNPGMANREIGTRVWGHDLADLVFEAVHVLVEPDREDRVGTVLFSVGS